MVYETPEGGNLPRITSKVAGPSRMIEDLRSVEVASEGSADRLNAGSEFLWRPEPGEIGKAAAAVATLQFVLWSTSLSLVLSTWITSVGLFTQSSRETSI